MWAPADLFTPTINAIALALKRAITLFWNNLLLSSLALAVAIALVVAISSSRGKDRGSNDG